MFIGTAIGCAATGGICEELGDADTEEEVMRRADTLETQSSRSGRRAGVFDLDRRDTSPGIEEWQLEKRRKER